MGGNKMFLGHYAVGLASKRVAPRASLGVLIAAPILLDLLWPIFLLLGWENVAVEPNSNPFLRFAFMSYPLSHGLVAVMAWATLFASIYFGLARYLAGAVVVWFTVVSHWVLDYIVHRPDLPLYAGGSRVSGGSRLYGLGLWNHRWYTIALELVMLAIGIFLYLRQTRAKDKIGTFAFAAMVVLLLAAYGAAAFAPQRPMGVKTIAAATLATLVFVILAWWFDSHREATVAEAPA